MPKRKKHMKLPNGFGSIRYLGPNRRKPYGAFPPVTQFTRDGRAVQPKAIGYAEDWYTAYDLLVAWRNNLQLPAAASTVQIQRKGPTFAEVYERYYNDKFLSNTAKKLSESSKQAAQAGYKHCRDLHDREFSHIRYEDLQAVVDNCPLKHASLELIVSLLHQMYRYAEKYELIDKDYSRYLEIKIPDDDEHGVPFRAAEIQSLWQHRTDETAQMLLIMIYSGFRISAYKTLTVNLDDWYFQGGVKTAASKNRIVPIHSAIRTIVAGRMEKYNTMLPMSVDNFRKRMSTFLATASIPAHTPHDARHTFSALCEQYGVNENDRKRMLGHAFQGDITNGIYGHRTLEDLRTEIEKIQVPAIHNQPVPTGTGWGGTRRHLSPCPRFEDCY